MNLRFSKFMFVAIMWIIMLGFVIFLVIISTNKREERNAEIDVICNEHNMERHSIKSINYCMDENGQLFVPSKLR